MSEATGEFAYAAPAPAPRKKSAWAYFAARRFLFISILAHVIFGILATIWVVQTIQAKRKLTFTAAPPTNSPSKRAEEHDVQMAKKRKTMSAPVQAKRIVTLASNVKVALPQMPVLPMTSIVNPMRMAGMSLTGNGLGSGPDGGGGNGSGSGGNGPQLFGFRGKGGFTGAFYDFKQDQMGNPTDMAGQIPTNGDLTHPPENAAETRADALDNNKVRELAASGFDESILSNYFKGPDTLNATQIYIPTILAELGPKAFNLEDKVKGRRWIVIYRATVRPPVSGTYRFVGSADDFIIVRFNNQTVLDGSITDPTGWQPNRKFTVPGVTQAEGYLREGSAIEVNSQDQYDMQVLIGELPGGHSTFTLEIEKEGEPGPPFPIFKLARSEMQQGEGAQFAPDTPWSIWRAEKSSGFSGF